MAIQPKQLGQSRPANTNAASIYRPAPGITGIVSSVCIVNTGSSRILVRIFHDDDGVTYDESTALLWDEPIDPGSPFYRDCYWPANNSGGNFAVRTDTANDAVFTFYGSEKS